jgi:hypothetical protein
VLALAGLSALGPATWFGCRGVRIPEPPEGTQPDDPHEATCVEGPPPTARLEELPPQPPGAGARAVWIDGAWIWRDGAWAWQPGAWAEPPPWAFYVRPKLVRLANGALVWFPGHWHTREDEREARAFGRAPAASGSVACPTPSASASASASASDAGVLDAD